MCVLKKHPDIIKAREDIVKLQKEIVVKVNKTDFLDLKDKFNMQNVDIVNLNDAVDKIQEITDYVNAGKFIDDNIDFLTDDKKIRLRLREFSLKQKEISDLLQRANPFDIISNMRVQNRIDNNQDEESNYFNNITNINDNNIKSSRNKLMTKDDESEKFKEKKEMISTSSENKNQLIKIPGTPRKGMLETPNDNNIQGSQSNINKVISQIIFTFKLRNLNFFLLNKYHHP